MISISFHSNRPTSRLAVLGMVLALVGGSGAALANDVIIGPVGSDGKLRITGDQDDNDITITESNGEFTITGNGLTTINGARQPVTIKPPPTVKKLDVRMNLGDDIVNLDGVDVDDVKIKDEQGDNTTTVTNGSVTNELEITHGPGNDRVTVTGTTRGSDDIDADGGRNRVNVESGSSQQSNASPGTGTGAGGVMPGENGFPASGVDNEPGRLDYAPDSSNSQNGSIGSVDLPNVRLFFDTGFVAQRMPIDSGSLGVIGVQQDERGLLGIPTVLYAGAANGGASFGNIPIGEESDLQFKVGFSFSGTEKDSSRDVAPMQNVVNGLTYYDYDSGGSPGVSSNGAGLSGDSHVSFNRIAFDAVAKVGNPCALGDDDDDGFGLPGFEEPRIYFALGPIFDYTQIDLDQTVQLFNPSPGFGQFDVSINTDVKIQDYRYGATLGAYYTMPFPETDNIALSFGGSVFLGGYDSKVDATQGFNCFISFANTPNTNECGNFNIQDFERDYDLSNSGFDYGLDGMMRLDYRVPEFLDGKLSLGAVYGVKYTGISQLDAPVNLDEDGPLDQKWKHVVSHSVTLQASYSF